MASAQSGFETFAVTADKGIRAWGGELAVVFREAARGLWSLMVERAEVKPRQSIAVTVEAGDRESLLVAWLNELLYLYDAKRFVGWSCRISDLTDTRLDAAVVGETVDPTRHVILSHVKAVTYHQLRVASTESGWEATVVVDV
jgi:SHS2 domain-containing protein